MHPHFGRLFARIGQFSPNLADSQENLSLIGRAAQVTFSTDICEFTNWHTRTVRFAIDTPPKRRDTQLTHKRRIPTNFPLIGEPRYNSEFTSNCSKPPCKLTDSEFGCCHDLTASEFISLVGTSSHHRCGYSNIFQKKYPLNSGEIHRRRHYSCLLYTSPSPRD